MRPYSEKFIHYLTVKQIIEKNRSHFCPQSVGAGRPRDERRRKSRSVSDPEKTVGVNRVIRVVSSGDLTFAIDESAPAANDSSLNSEGPTQDFPAKEPSFVGTPGGHTVCMTTSGFTLALALLLTVLLASCGLSAYLCARIRPFARRLKKAQQATSATVIPAATLTSTTKNAVTNCCYS